MKKKILAMLMVTTLAVSTLIGCGSGTETGNSGDEAATEESSTEAVDAVEDADTGEAYNINMQIITWGQAPDEIAEVEAAINAIIESEINATVTLNPIAAWDLITESNNSITAGEKVDLICIFTFGQGMDSITTYTSKGMLNELDELYAAYGTDIAPVLGEEINLGYIGETLYAIPSKSNYGTGRAFLARKDYLDEIGVTADENKLYTVDELTEIFEKFSDKYGAGYYPVALYGGAGEDAFEHFNEVDSLGSQTSNGVLMQAGLDGNTTVVNLYETDEYMNYCKQMHTWYQAGYINPDVNTLADDITSQMKSGNYLGSLGTSYPGSKIALQNTIGVDIVELKLVEPYATTSVASQALWAIPVTSENPERVMKFLNILYQDRELANDVDSLLSVGLNDVSYTVEEEVDGSKAIIVPKEGGTWSTWVPGGLYGDAFTCPQFAPNDNTYYDQVTEFNDGIISSGRITDTFGYVFDGTPVSAQVTAVSAVVQQYRSLAGYGAVDPEEIMPEFITALKDAGIDDIITENQKQLDAWLETK